MNDIDQLVSGLVILKAHSKDQLGVHCDPQESLVVSGVPSSLPPSTQEILRKMGWRVAFAWKPNHWYWSN